MLNFRTDLADERANFLKKNNKKDLNIDGIEINVNKNEDITITEIKITNNNGVKAIGKPIGNYITLDIKNIKILGDEEIEKYGRELSKELKKMLDRHCSRTDEILVVGLGNIYVTPDSLGPKVVNEIDITRHIFKYMPEVLEKDTRPVSAISPGVLGTTGIETLEIITGIIQKIKPKLVIVIDALASRSIERISSSIQLSDTGITPGAGVENARQEISEKTLNIPVIALGIPTVVESAVLVNDCLDIFIKKLEKQSNSIELIKNFQDKDNYEIIKEALIPNNYNMIVTPKEIDGLIENMKEIVAKGINYAINNYPPV